MDKLYTSLHNAIDLFKNRFLSIGFLLIIILKVHTSVLAQCVPPPPPTVIPNPAFVCLGGPPVKLKIIPTPYCSGPVNIAVPDNNAAGASSTIPVAGTPANCTVTGIAVTINMTHTRIGDMVFVLKAPNGIILSLDNRLTGTNSTAASTGFTNTVISNTAFTLLLNGTNPYTGNFKADILNTPGAGPTGMIPTATSWASLFTVLNGAWTLGFYDAASGETGTLNSWCISFTGNCGAYAYPALPGVWSPFAGLFYDPAATAPYTGLPVDSLYARPYLPGTYTYQVTTQSLPLPGCTSAPTAVTVIVGATVSIITQPADQNVCPGNDAHFTVATAGAGLTYQWQLSADGGATFTNLINGGPFSGVTTAALTIAAPPLSMSGQRFRVVINGNATCGGIASNAAILTVNPLPAVSFYAHPYHNLLPGLTLTLSSVVTPAAGSNTWYRDGLPVPGANADTLLVDFDHIGLYMLQVTDINGCSNISDTISVRDSAHLRMFVYPNPSNGSFQTRLYSTPSTSVARTLVLYNNMGNRVLTKPYNQTSPWQRIDVDVRNSGKGLYWVEIIDKDGKRISLSRVLIQ